MSQSLQHLLERLANCAPAERIELRDDILLRIVHEEADAGHPPLTAIVVSKSTGRPGDGFLPAMIEIGFAQPGETSSDLWARAVVAVHEFWRDKA